MDQLLKKHPWIGKALEQKKPTPEEKEPDEEEEVQAPAELDADVVASVMSALQDKREEMSLTHGGVHSIDFEVVVLGGKWTMQHVGVPCDAFKGQAKSQESKYCCRIHGLTMCFFCFFQAMW